MRKPSSPPADLAALAASPSIACSTARHTASAVTGNKDAPGEQSGQSVVEAATAAAGPEAVEGTDAVETAVEPDSEGGLAGGGRGGRTIRCQKKRLLRAGASLRSEKAGSLPAGSCVEVLGEAEVLDAAGHASTRLRCGQGWFTEQSGAVQTLQAAGVSVMAVAKANRKLTGRRGKGRKGAVTGGDVLTEGAHYFALEFTLTAEHDDDTLYIAHAYPYSYTKLQARLAEVERSPCVLERRTIATSLGGRNVEALTITEPPLERKGAWCGEGDSEDCLPLEERQRVVLSARVHPGDWSCHCPVRSAGRV